MAQSFSVQFRFDRTLGNYSISLTDTSTAVTLQSGMFTISFPDTTKSSYLATIGGTTEVPASNIVINNQVLSGNYIIVFSAKNSLGQDISTTREFYFDYEFPEHIIANKSDALVPEVKFQDDTIYSPIGSFTGSVNRVISANYPTTSALSGQSKSSTTAILDMVNSGNYYEGIYNVSAVSEVSCQNISFDWLTLYYKNSVSSEFDIKRVLSQLELLIKLNQYKEQIDVGSSVDDCDFTCSKEGYDLAVSLYSHILYRAQNGLLDGTEDSFKQLISIISPYSTHVYQSTPISGFNIVNYDGTVKSVGLSMPSAFNVSNSPITTEGVISVTMSGLVSEFLRGNGSLASLTDVEIKNILGLTPISLNSLNATAPLLYNQATGNFSINQANYSQDGYLSGDDWYRFNNKQDVLNGIGLVRANGGTIVYDNNSYYLSSNPSNYISLGSLSAISPIFYNSSTGEISMSQASVYSGGYLAQEDYLLFLNKQTQLEGQGFVKLNGTNISYDNTEYYPASNPNNYITLSSISADAPLIYNVSTGKITLPRADNDNDGYLSLDDWNIFNNKLSSVQWGIITGNVTDSQALVDYINQQSASGGITLEITRTKGVATLDTGVLDIPEYAPKFGWIQLVTGENAIPTVLSETSSQVIVQYTYDTGKTYYRNIMTDLSEDAFYESYSGGVFSGLIEKRKININV